MLRINVSPARCVAKKRSSYPNF